MPDNDAPFEQVLRALQRITDEMGELRSALQSSERSVVDRTQQVIRDSAQDSETRLAAMVKDAVQDLETRLTALLRDSDQDMETRLTKLVRDTEANLLSAFFVFQEHEKFQFQRLKADSGNAARAGELRIDNLEQRILELERRVLRMSDDPAPPPS